MLVCLNLFNLPHCWQAHPIVTLEPNAGYLYSASWSPVRPLVIAIATASGKLFLYDLKQKRSAPVLELDAGQGGCPVYSLSFNQRQYVYVLSYFIYYVNIHSLSIIKIGFGLYLRENKAFNFV